MPVTPKHSEKLFLYTLGVTLLIKIAIAAALPITGDEAYFVLWGRHPDYGYYDHPPMVGWWLSLIGHLGGTELLVRLPALLLSTIIGLVLYRMLHGHDRERALLVATLWLLFPLNVVNVLITTDTPLILFAFLSGVTLHTALRTNRARHYVLCGILLGLAFLSKYFAVLLGLAVLVFMLWARRDREGLKGLGLIIAGALPFALVNVYWNYQHCWDNVLFNLFNRTQGLELSPVNLLAYAGMLLYLATPPVLYYLARNWKSSRRRRAPGPDHRVFFFLALVPLLVLAAISLRKLVGLHWVLAFFPFLMWLVWAVLDKRQLSRSIKFMGGFTLLHVAALGVVLALPLDAWEGTRHYRAIVFGTRTDAIIDRLRTYQGRFQIAADSYTRAAVLSFYYKRHVAVFGKGSFHARQDDILTDFRELGGADILIIAKTPERQHEYAEYFQSADLEQWTQDGATFPVVLGYNFDYQKYKTEVLRRIRDEYYAIPAYLPTGACYFYDRYFPESKPY